MTKIIFLGVGGALVHAPADNHTAFLVRTDTSTILLDSGPSIMRQLELTGVGMEELTHIYISRSGRKALRRGNPGATGRRYNDALTRWRDLKRGLGITMTQSGHSEIHTHKQAPCSDAWGLFVFIRKLLGPGNNGHFAVFTFTGAFSKDFWMVT